MIPHVQDVPPVQSDSNYLKILRWQLTGADPELTGCRSESDQFRGEQ